MCRLLSRFARYSSSNKQEGWIIMHAKLCKREMRWDRDMPPAGRRRRRSSECDDPSPSMQSSWLLIVVCSCWGRGVMVRRSFAEASSLVRPLPLHIHTPVAGRRRAVLPLPCRRTERGRMQTAGQPPSCSCRCRLAASPYQPLCSGGRWLLAPRLFSCYGISDAAAEKIDPSKGGSGGHARWEARPGKERQAGRPAAVSVLHLCGRRGSSPRRRPRRATGGGRIFADDRPIMRCSMPLARRARTLAGMFAVRALYVQLGLLAPFFPCRRGTVRFEGWERRACTCGWLVHMECIQYSIRKFGFRAALLECRLRRPSSHHPTWKRAWDAGTIEVRPWLPPRTSHPQTYHGVENEIASAYSYISIRLL